MSAAAAVLGLAIAKILVRAYSATAADAIGDVQAGLSGLDVRALFGRERQNALVVRFTEELDDYIRTEFRHISENDREAALLSVEAAMKPVVEDRPLLLSGVIDPDRLYEQLMKRGGHRQGVDLGGDAAVLFERLLALSVDTLVKYAPHSPDFNRVATVKLIRDTDAILTQLTGTVDQVAALSSALQEEPIGLTLGPIEVDYRAGLVAVTEEVAGHTPLVMHVGTGASVTFDLSNRGSADIRIDGVFVKVLEHRAVHALYTVQTLGLSDVREYQCIIEPEPGLYACKQQFASRQYLRLVSGELERLRLTIGARRAGVYDVVATVRYSMGGHPVMLESTERVVIGVSDTLSSEPRARARRGDVRGWLHEDEEGLSPKAERALLSALDGPAIENSRKAAIELGKYGRAAAIEVLSDIIDDGDEGEYQRLEAVDLLGRCREGRATEILLRTLQHPRPAFRARAAQALGRLRDVRSVRALTLALQDPAVLKDAAEALGDLGNVAVPQLHSALADPQAAVRRAVVRGLSRVGPGAVEALVAALDDDDEEVRFWALDAIVVQRRQSSVEWLIPALSDSSDRVRGLALRQLDRFRDHSLPTLRRLAQEGDGQARDALASLDLPDVPGLIVLLDSADASARREELLASLEQAHRKLTDKRPRWRGGPEKLSADQARHKEQLLQ